MHIENINCMVLLVWVGLTIDWVMPIGHFTLELHQMTIVLPCFLTKLISLKWQYLGIKFMYKLVVLFSIKVSKTYNTEIKNNKINITITKSENNVSLYVNGEKMNMVKHLKGYISCERVVHNSDTLNRGYVHEVLVTETAVSSANAISMGQYSPITPRFYHKLDLDKIASWQGNAHKVSYQNTDLTIENVPQGASVWHEKADIDAWMARETDNS